MASSAGIHYVVHHGTIPTVPTRSVSRVDLGNDALEWAAPIHELTPGAPYRTVRRVMRSPVPIIDWWNSCDMPLSTRRTLRTERSASGSHIYLTIPVEGSMRVRHCGNDVDLSPGKYMVCTTAEPVILHRTVDSRIRNIFISEDQVQFCMPRIHGVIATPQAAVGAAALLLRYLDALDLTVDELTAEELDSAAAAARELFISALSAPSDGPGSASEGALFQQAVRYIERWLPDPRLTVESIARAHHVSVRTLQRAFESYGQTVSDFIRVQRLERCREDILARPEAPISVICARWGITDVTHFPRQYHKRFGENPSDTRRRAQG